MTRPTVQVRSVQGDGPEPIGLGYFVFLLLLKGPSGPGLRKTDTGERWRAESAGVYLRPGISACLSLP